MAEAVQVLHEEQKSRTDTVSSDLEMLEDDDLEDVAGGVYYIDSDTSELFRTGIPILAYEICQPLWKSG